MVHAGEVAILLPLPTTLGLTLVIIVTSHIRHEIHGPPKQLLEEEIQGSQERRFLEQFTQFLHSPTERRGVFLSRLGDEDHITGEVAGSFVMLAMRNLPGEIRNKQEGMTDPADGVVERLGRRKRLVPALVSQHPKSRPGHTLESRIQRPQNNPRGQIRNSLGGDEGVAEEEGRREQGYVARDIVQTGGRGSLEAVRGDGFSDLLDCVIGDFKFIAVRVEQGFGLLVVVVVAGGFGVGAQGG